MPVSGGDFSVVVESVSAIGAVVSVTPAPPAAAGTPAPAPRQPAGRVVMSGAGEEAPEAPVAAAEEPAKLWAPAYSGAADSSDTMLRSVSDAGSSTAYLVAVAGAALAGATLLVVRRLRRLRTAVR